MLELGHITQEEYDKAMAEDMHGALNPGQTKVEGISSTPMDYVKEKVVEDLMVAQKISYEEAENYLYKGGLTITSTIDVNMQKTLEDSYNNFSTLFLGAEPTADKPVAQDWRYFKSLNVNLSIDSEITITPKMMKDYILEKELRNE